MKAFLKKNLRVIIGISVFVLMLIADIVSKHLVHSSMAMGENRTIIPYLFNFEHHHNTGVAWGLGGNNSALMIVFTILNLLVAAALGFLLIKYGKRSKVLCIALGLIIAGALGNCIDRIFPRDPVGVCDFIQFAFWTSFPIFNFADISVICGLVTLLIYIIFIYKEPKKETAKISETTGVSEVENNTLKESDAGANVPQPKLKRKKNTEEEI